MSKYRLKKKEEFIRDGLWDKENNCPNDWASTGEMNKYLGIDVPDEYTAHCDKNEFFIYGGWMFLNTNYILKEQEYFDDLSQHIGRYIRALVDNPHSGSMVKKGDVGKIINKGQVDFPNRKGYSCTCALDRNHLGTKYELLPEDYSPEQENKEPNIEFIPGKWYKVELSNKFNHYIKVDSVTEDEIILDCEGYVANLNKWNKGTSIDLKTVTKYELLTYLSEIQKYLPDGHPDKVKNFKLEVGKWYSFNWDYFGKDRIVIAKIKKVEEDCFAVSWRSYLWLDKSYSDSDAYHFKDISNIKELSIQEVQPYLPNEHPDKIINEKFEIGKWYKWYQKNHGKYHYGKVEKINLETDTLAMSPWIIQCDEYQFSGYFALSEAEQIQEISVEEVQEFLPKNHSDKISSDIFKKGEYIVITDNYSGGFCTSYIYKQRENYKHLRSELDNKNSKTNGLGGINKSNSDTWRYATQEEIDEYERRGKPYDVTELQKKELSMQEIQEECKKKYPIGCTYINTSETKCVLKEDSYTYSIVNKQIWAHSMGGYLYEDGKWAELVSLPEENIIEIPEYIEAIGSFCDYFISGKIYKVIDSDNLLSVKLNCNDLFNFKEYHNLYIDLTRYRWKPSTKEAYEQQKPLNYESVSGCFPIDKNIFIYDEVGQYPSTSSDYWENIPKFVEQKEFDIYGPTPDIQ